MKTNILVESYRKLSKVELNKFTQFVLSPYFNKNKSVILLHENLLKHFPVFDPQKCNKQVLFDIIFPKIAFKENKWKDINHQLLKLFEIFLANENLKKNPLEMHELVLNECKTKDLDNLLKKRLKIAFNSVNKDDFNANKKTYYKYIFNHIAYEFEEVKGNRKKSNIYLQRRADHLDKFYFTEKMILGAVMLNRQNQLNSKLDFKFFDEFEKMLEKKDFDFKDDKVFLVNQSLYHLLKTEKKENYLQLKGLIYNGSFTENEKRTYYTFLRNFCALKINIGKSEYLQELFDLNKKVIAESIVLDDNNISEWLFKNFIAVGLRLKEFEWTKDFIEEYSKFLNPKVLQNAYSYNMANLNYAQKEYEQAQTFLIQTEFTDMVYALSSRALLAKIYYETNEFESLDSLLHSFRLFLIRLKDISANKKETYLNLIKLMENLLKYKQSIITQSAKDIAVYKKRTVEKIKQSKNVANKTWLLEKLAQL